MAAPQNTFVSNDMVGIREDLSDIIYTVSPMATPFLSMARRTEAQNTVHEWQIDSLADPTNNAQLEGDDPPFVAVTPTARLNNLTQISFKAASVSGTGRAVDTAGRADELDYQVLKRGRELKRDMETVLLSNKAKAVGSDTVPRELAGVPSWIHSNVDFEATGANPTGDGTDTRTDGGQRDFTQTQLKDILQAIFEAGGTPDVLMTGPYNRSVFSTFSDNATNFARTESDTISATFEIYESDFGQIKAVPNNFMRPRDVFVFEMDMWAVAFLSGRNMATSPLAKTGDSDARLILSEYTLEARNEKASGAIYDLNTAATP